MAVIALAGALTLAGCGDAYHGPRGETNDEVEMQKVAGASPDRTATHPTVRPIRDDR
ncbi:MAG: hypothetical protein KIT09_32675 [Bryobacteraceae bacterium]|nr:hypothetical protein [Bryobacteraceae bacterium]